MPERYFRFTLLLLSVLLSGCFGGVAPRGEAATYDLSGAVAVDPSIQTIQTADITGAAPLMLRLAEVQAPTWLNTSAMQYRLSYAEAERRFSFAESRWAAPPAELIESVLRRGRFVTRSRIETEGCQLHVELLEFVQVFDAPGHSRALVETRISLLGPRQSRLLGQWHFVHSPAAGIDARSGVDGFVVAVREMGRDLGVHLARLQHESPQLIGQCQAGVL